MVGLRSISPGHPASCQFDNLDGVIEESAGLIFKRPRKAKAR
jgi:hypothetical protein